ncbi:TPA: helix-turn-helix domain-containing protein, partial [Klebsiella quasipneumoniae]
MTGLHPKNVMEHTNMNSNNQVKQLRLQRAWSQEQLAEMAGLSV